MTAEAITATPKWLFAMLIRIRSAPLSREHSRMVKTNGAVMNASAICSYSISELAANSWPCRLKCIALSSGLENGIETE